jgi:hypothetical protein
MQETAKSALLIRRPYKEGDRWGMWYVWGRRKMNTGFWWGTLTGRKHSNKQAQMEG